MVVLPELLQAHGGERVQTSVKFPVALAIVLDDGLELGEEVGFSALLAKIYRRYTVKLLYKLFPNSHSILHTGFIFSKKQGAVVCIDISCGKCGQSSCDSGAKHLQIFPFYYL